MKVKEIDHICFAFRSLAKARKSYDGILGLEPDCEYEAPEESIRVIRYYLGGWPLSYWSQPHRIARWDDSSLRVGKVSS